MHPGDAEGMADCVDPDQGLHSLLSPVCSRFATVREKYLKNEIFSRSGKSQVSSLGNLERTWKVREKPAKLKINGYGRQSSENLFILFKKGKDVFSHEIV